MPVNAQTAPAAWRLGLSIGLDRRRGLFLPIAALLALACLILVVTSFLLTFRQSYAGLSVQARRDGVWVVDLLDPSGAAVQAGLREGDRIVSVDGEDAGLLARGRMRFSIGPAERLVIQRTGASAESEVDVERSTPASVWDPLLMLVLALSFWVTGCAALLVRPRDHVVRILFLCNLAGAAATGNAVAADRGVYWLAMIEPALMLAATTLLAHLFLIFPLQRRASFCSIPIVLWGLYALTSMALALRVLAQVAVPELQSAARSALFLAMCAGFVIAAGSLVGSYRALPARESRQVRLVVTGTLLSMSPFIFLSLVPLALTGNYILRPLTAVIFAVIMPFSFTYAILRHKLLGIDLLVVRGLVYGLCAVLLLVTYFVLVWGSRWLLGAASIANVVDDTVVELVLLALSVLSFGSVYDRLRRWIDRHFYKDYYDYRETLLSLSASMANLQQPQHLASALVVGVGQAMGLSAAALYGQDQSQAARPIATWTDEHAVGGQRFPELEKRLSTSPEKPQKIELLDDGALLVPLVCRGHHTGVLALGTKRSGVAFRSVDVDLLSTLASNAATALENARLFAEVGRSEALREMARLKEEFVSTISHDLRSPLTPIIGYAEVLSHRRFPPEEVHEMASAILTAGQQMHRLVEDLLGVARLGRTELGLEKREVDLVELAAQVVLGFTVGAEGNRVQINRPERPVLAHVDPERITQVLTNLLSNAVRYSPQGGEIEVAVIEDETRACLTVSDHGIGIPRKELSNIFEQFYRVQSEQTAGIEGTGLGLSICRNLVEAHGGAIWADSEVGRGSTFFVSLPLGGG